MESKNLKDVYNRLIDLYGFYEINKDSDEYKIALRFMSQEDLLKDDIDNIRLLVKDDGEDYMYFIINENTDYIGGGACGEEMITKYRYIILLLGTAVSFVFGFVVAFALAKLCGVMAVKAVLNIAFTAGGITGMLGFVCICLAELRRI